MMKTIVVQPPDSYKRVSANPFPGSFRSRVRPPSPLPLRLIRALQIQIRTSFAWHLGLAIRCIFGVVLNVVSTTRKHTLDLAFATEVAAAFDGHVDVEVCWWSRRVYVEVEIEERGGVWCRLLSLLDRLMLVP